MVLIAKKTWKLKMIVPFLLLWVTANIAYAQKENITQQYFSIMPGPAGISNVRCVTEDKFGFIWIATQDGIFRYDSRQMDAYNTDFPDNRLIESSDVRTIYIDSSANKIWFISAGGGFNEADLATGNIEMRANIADGSTNKLNFINKICYWQNKFYLVSGNGIAIYDRATGQISMVPEVGLSQAEIDDALIDKNYLLLFTRKGRLIKYNLADKKIVQNVQLVKNAGIEGVRFYNSVIRNNGIYTASSMGILNFSFLNDSIINETGELYFIPSSVNRHVTGICFDKRGELWFSNENGLYKADLEKKTCSNAAQASVMLPNPLNAVFNLFCDSENNIWLGCQQGLSMIKNAAPAFEVINTGSGSPATIKQAYYIYPVSDSTFYSCAENGLFFVNEKRRSITGVDESRAYDYVFTDPYSVFWMSNSDGVFCRKTNKIIPVQMVYREFEKVGKFRVNSSVRVNDSCIAFGTEDYKGVLLWNFKKHWVISFTAGAGSIRLKENVTNTVKLLDSNKICILGDAFFGIADLKKKSYTNIELTRSDGKQYALFFDLCKARQTYYMACYGLGIVILDNQFSKIGEITTKNGLSNNGVYKLIPWRDSLLFITTNYGLNVYNLSTKKISFYLKSDGLHGDVFEETSGNIYGDKIYAGGKGGVSLVYPLKLATGSRPPPLYFYKIEMQLPNGKRMDTLNVLATKIMVPSTVVQTSISFSAINFSNPERTVYMYRIVEKSRDWIDLHAQNFITLIGLSPGTYHLEVKAANEDGVWSEPKELLLVFLPKWYQTWWFYALIALTAAAILYALYRYRISQIKKQHEIRKNIATDLHDDLGSTLNSVKVFTNLAISGVKQEESLQQVKDNLTEATMSLRDMIWVLDDSMDTVDELVTRLKQFAIPVTEASNMNFVIQAGSDVNSRILSKEEKRNLFLICKEAINNSIKYSGATIITVDIKPAGKKIQITIADDGKGFDEGSVKKGYGLKNMQYRAGQVKYEAALISQPGKGTSVAIMPV